MLSRPWLRLFRQVSFFSFTAMPWGGCLLSGAHNEPRALKGPYLARDPTVNPQLTGHCPRQGTFYCPEWPEVRVTGFRAGRFLTAPVSGLERGWVFPKPALSQTERSQSFLQALLREIPMSAVLVIPKASRPWQPLCEWVTRLESVVWQVLESDRHGLQSWLYHQLALWGEA